MWKCPECDEEITTLKYEVNTNSYEYGDALLSNTQETRRGDIITEHDFSDNGDTEWDGDPEYKCPECENQINPTNLIWIGDEEDTTEETKNTSAEIEENPKQSITKKWREFLGNENSFGFRQQNGERPDDIMRNCNICPKCKYLFPRECSDTTSETTAICPNCNLEFNQRQAQEEIRKKSNKGLSIIKVVVSTRIKRNVKRI